MRTDKLRKADIVKRAILVFVTILTIFPFAWMILLSFKNNTEIMQHPFSLPKTINFDNYIKAFQNLDLVTMFKNTFFVSVLALIISVTVSFLSSYCIARLYFKNKKLPFFLYLLFVAGLTIPTYIMIFPVYRITMKLGMVNTYASLILPFSANTIALDTLLFYGYLKGFPTEIEEAGVIDGTNITNLLIRIVIPIVKPVIATVTIFNFVYFWNEFPMTSVLIRSPEKWTVALAASMFKGKYNMNYGGLLAATMIIILPEIVFYLLFQKDIVDGMTAGAVKG